jgi:hypothetical protein
MKKKPDEPDESGSKHQHAGTVATENPGGGPPGERQEVGNAASSRRDPPHVTENDEGAPVQDAREGASGPVLPANAAGHDKVSSAEQDVGINHTSAYDRRPTQDKDSPPSGR